MNNFFRFGTGLLSSLMIIKSRPKRVFVNVTLVKKMFMSLYQKLQNWLGISNTKIKQKTDSNAIIENDIIIIQSPFDFYPISSKFKVWSYKKVEEGDSLIVLKGLDLTKDIALAAWKEYAVDQVLLADAAHAAVATSRACAAVAARTAAATATAAAAATAVAAAEATAAAGGATYWKSYDQANKEFRNTGKIKGFEILNLQTMEKLWISRYDMEILTK